MHIHIKTPFIAAFLLFAAIILSSCEAEKENNAESGDFPTTFKVDIPSSISRTVSLKNADSDAFSGREIYEHLNNFISVGESAAELVEEIMKGISSLELNKPMNTNFPSQEDGRSKNIVVLENSEFEGKSWAYQLTISDVENTGNIDGGKALQVFWNTNPVNGIAILKPENWDVSSNSMQSVVFKVEYSEAQEYGYDAHMIVSITNWEEDRNDRFHMDELKMFVGKSDDIIDVYGNSNHPDAYLFLENPKGFSWAFVASGNENTNIGVAQVGLPPVTLDESSRSILLEDYSIENVFTEQINQWVFNQHGVYPDSNMLVNLLVNTQAPGFFNQNGFIQGGELPSSDYEVLVNNINLLTPYNPFIVSQMEINFK